MKVFSRLAAAGTFAIAASVGVAQAANDANTTENLADKCVSQAISDLFDALGAGTKGTTIEVDVSPIVELCENQTGEKVTAWRHLTKMKATW